MNRNFPQNNGNGSGKKPFGGEKIKYPVTFILKAVMDATTPDEENKASLKEVFDLLEIEHVFKNRRLSSKGNYISFTYKVTLVSGSQMNDMYLHLKKIKGLKFAL